MILVSSLPNLLKPGLKVKNEDVVGAAPTGNVPTSSEWSAILLPTKVHLILEVWRQLFGENDYVTKRLDSLSHHGLVMP